MSSQEEIKRTVGTLLYSALLKISFCFVFLDSLITLVKERRAVCLSNCICVHLYTVLKRLGLVSDSQSGDARPPSNVRVIAGLEEHNLSLSRGRAVPAVVDGRGCSLSSTLSSKKPLVPQPPKSSAGSPFYPFLSSVTSGHDNDELLTTQILKCAHLKTTASVMRDIMSVL